MVPLTLLATASRRARWRCRPLARSRRGCAHRRGRSRGATPFQLYSMHRKPFRSPPLGFAVMGVHMLARCGIADHLADVFAVFHHGVASAEDLQRHLVTDRDVGLVMDEEVGGLPMLVSFHGFRMILGAAARPALISAKARAPSQSGRISAQSSAPRRPSKTACAVSLKSARV